MDTKQFFAELWERYSEITPQAGQIHQLFEQMEGAVVNDHVAFRTFDYGRFAIDQLEPRLFGLGYRRDQPYEFPEKKLSAWSYVTDAPDQPLIFLSELHLQQLSTPNRELLQALLDSAEQALPDGPEAFFAGRLWRRPSWQEYRQLEEESDYAAWLSIWGYLANHFTVSVNRLQHLQSLQQVVDFLEANHFQLNAAGGIIKGSPQLLLEQASTLADEVQVSFSDGLRHPVPSCYYEFARRYADADGKLYRGFVAASADKIFQSTDRQRGAAGQ